MDACEISSSSTIIPVGYVILTRGIILTVGSLWGMVLCIRIGIKEDEVGLREVVGLGDVAL